eukprot:TRINITY_DN55386_c0_g1_i1.p1 TRINITY_DN55386_c0_g1~~TRINITY_DN55386_c0_g1_i1.p1  ORF type:complete len:225 (+),score=16.18 TRINITY_DN55386_c0_g1_i1:88-675(+)
MLTVFSLLGQRWLAAAKTFSFPKHLFVGCGILCVSLVSMVSVGLATGFLVLSMPKVGRQMVTTLFRTFFVPAFVEESFWRAMLLPHPRVDDPPASASWLRLAVTVTVFVSYHIPGGYLLTKSGVAPGAFSTFCEPCFLVIAFLLGVSCAAGHELCDGSLWVSVFLHYVPVVLWLEFGGGNERLRPEGPYQRDLFA